LESTYDDYFPARASVGTLRLAGITY